MMSEERLKKFCTDDVNYLDLGSASDWLGCEGNLLQPIRQTDSLYFTTMILKAMQLMGSCIKTRPKNEIYTY